MQKRKNRAEDREENDVEQNNDNEPDYHPLEMLQDNGINNGDIKKLIDAGYNSLESVAYTPKKNLTVIKGLSELKVNKIIKAVFNLL